MSKLLTRDEFREAVFQRDGYKCTVRSSDANCRYVLSKFFDKNAKVKLDAHHIMERRLFPDGGYYLDNGATVCEPCHLWCEMTLVDTDEVRKGCGITNVILPPHLYQDQKYDKWGNPMLDNGMRLRGELFDDESVQKALRSVLNLFTSHVKYPRTYHLPWSPGATSDDRIMEDPDVCFGDKEVVVTEKMDGENCTMYRDYIHARSLDYSPHPSRDRVKAMWAQVAHDIPDGWRVCGENLYALHSIPYDDLESYFQVFSIWNEKNECLSWDETKEWASLLGFKTVREIDRRVWDDKLAAILPSQGKLVQGEGYVVRLASSFHYKDFRRSVAKYVRKDHVVHRDGHWSNRPVVPNKLGE